MQDEPTPINEAITALTAAARPTRTVGAGTTGEHSEPVDFAAIACHVLTAVAANLGGVEDLLAGRPGSWEADYVRQIVHGTAGDSAEELLRWRTEPLRLPLDTRAQLAELGLEDPYGEAATEAARRENEAHEALLMAFATPAERASFRAAIESRSGG